MNKTKGLLAVLLLAGCASTTAPAPEPVLVSPQVVQLPPGGRFINDRQGIELKPGLYRFVRSEPGHRDNSKEVWVQAGQSFFIDLEPGIGYAQVSMAGQPAQATLLLNGEPQALPFSAELDVGQYSIQISAAGYRTHTQSIRVQAGKPLQLDYSLQPLPTEAEFSLSTTPPAHRILINGTAYAADKVPPRLPFGDYHVQAVHQLASDKRLIGEIALQLALDAPGNFELALTTEQWQVNGQWLAKAQAQRALAEAATLAEQARLAALAAARAAEQTAYQQQRIAMPYQLEFNHPVSPPELETAELARQLHAILQVGDRLHLETSQGTVLIWKRSPQLSASFTDAVAAWQQQADWRPDYADDPVTTLSITPGDLLLPSLAYQRYRFANQAPLLDANRHQLPPDGITLGHQLAQGSIGILAIGGQQVQITATEGQQSGSLFMATVPAATASLTIHWQSQPQQLLVFSEQEVPLSVPVLPTQLQQGEKYDFALPVHNVERIDVFTRLPDQSWQHKRLQPSQIGGATLAVEQSEIGPHRLPGDYQRVWQLHYLQQGQPLSRQFSHHYQVGETALDGRSQHFLRREPD